MWGTPSQTKRRASELNDEGPGAQHRGPRRSSVYDYETKRDSIAVRSVRTETPVAPASRYP